MVVGGWKGPYRVLQLVICRTEGPCLNTSLVVKTISLAFHETAQGSKRTPHATIEVHSKRTCTQKARCTHTRDLTMCTNERQIVHLAVEYCALANLPATLPTSLGSIAHWSLLVWSRQGHPHLHGNAGKLHRWIPQRALCLLVFGVGRRVGGWVGDTKTYPKIWVEIWIGLFRSVWGTKPYPKIRDKIWICFFR